MIYEVNFNICALIIYLFTVYYMAVKKNTYKLQNRFFFAITIACVVCTLADIVNAIFLNVRVLPTMLSMMETQGVDSVFRNTLMQALSLNMTMLFANAPVAVQKALMYVSIYTYLLPHNLLPPLFCFYIMHVLGLTSKRKKSFFAILCLPFCCSLLLVATNPFTHIVFYYDQSLFYNRGPAMFALYTVALFYIIMDIVCVVRYSNALSSTKSFALLLFVISCVLAIVLQYFFQNILIELFVESIALLCILFTIENDSEIYNNVTHVYNRSAFLMENTASIETKTEYTIVVVKLLNMAYYNSILGYNFMGGVAQEVSLYLTSVSSRESVYDCENGNFAIMLYHTSPEKTGRLVKTLRTHFADDLTHKDINIPFTTQICVINLPHDINTVEDLMVLVDTASTKTGSRVSLMSGIQMKLLQRKAAVEKAVQRALSNRSFKVFYQPIWNCQTGRIHSAEALVRIFDEELGDISPEEFIPIAEKNGTIFEIGEYVFENTCRMFSKEGLKNIGIQFIEVNLSPVQCMRKNIADTFRAILEKYSVSASSINLEITESAAISNPEMFLQTMQELRNMRFTFSLDDYGTGYSNASYIFNLDFDIIKLDKSILWQAGEKATAKIILDNTIRMIKQMNLKIVMEGVETEEQKNIVSRMGVDYCQGHLISKPLDESSFIEFCKEFNRNSI